MTRDEQERIAAEIARECHEAMNVKVPGTIWEGPGPELFREILTKHILRALTLALPSSRIRSAEGRVIDAAMRGETLVTADKRRAAAEWLAGLREATSRLADLREQHAAEECGAVCNVQSRMTPGGLPRGDDVRCHLARGHEGDHEGVGAPYRWRP